MEFKTLGFIFINTRNQISKPGYNPFSERYALSLKVMLYWFKTSDFANNIKKKKKKLLVATLILMSYIYLLI